MDVMYNYSKAKIKSSLEIDKIMKKLENTYQDASLIKKALWGDASDKEQQVLEQRLSMHPELKAVYEKLQDSEELKDAFNKYKKYSSEKAYEHFLQQIQQKENWKDPPYPVMVVCCRSGGSTGSRNFFLCHKSLSGSGGVPDTYRANQAG